MHRLNRLLVGCVALAVALVVAGVSVAMARSSHVAAKVTVKTTGGERFVPNKKNPPNKAVLEELAFSKGTITVKSGGTVTWVYRDKSGDPHTITVAKRNQLPKSFAGCRTPCKIAGGHLNDPNDPTQGIKQPVLNAGKPGLDRVGDSLVLPPHGKVSAKISAKAGSVLYYICAVHPWMQGKIVVK